MSGNKDNSKTRAIIESDGSLDLYKAGSIAIRFSPTGNSFLNTGNIAIDTTDPGSYKLAVEGTIGARRVKVTQQVWADFVFDSAYILTPLNEIETYAKSSKHLPGIPSAKEIEQQGLDVGDIQQRQMQKIEELTLYLIDQNRKLEAPQELILALSRYHLARFVFLLI